MSYREKQLFSWTTAALAVVTVAALLSSFNGGVSVGFSNHTGLMPVVRRILDPNYLPNDFGIALRFYHHRVFAYLVAGASYLIGEDNALIALHIAGMTLLSAALFYLCRLAGLNLSGFLAVGLFVAANFAWAGLSLEENHFVGNRDIQPTTFAHALIVFAVAGLIERRYHLVAFLAGLVMFLHVQIGVIFALVLIPFYLAAIRTFSVGDILRFAVLFFVPASPSLSHLSHMTQKGLLDSSLALYYIDFRHPHHFELMSAKHAVGVAGNLAAQTVAYLWLRRQEGYTTERRAVGVMFAVSALLAAFALLHFADYYVLRVGTILKIQFIRLSSLITVCGVICAVAALNVWWQERAAHQTRAERRPRINVVMASLVAVGVLWSAYSVAVAGRDPHPLLGVRRYAEQKSGWVDACLWVKAHGPRDTIYLTPPDTRGFAYLSDRSTIVEFKTNPDGGQFLAEWFERLRDLGGGSLPAYRGFKNGSTLNKAYATLGTEQIAALGEKYGARYAVLPKASPAQFETVYENNQYRIVKLPTAP